MSTATVEAAAPGFRSPATGEVALLDLHGVGFFSLQDAQTGYGRPTGYGSLADARRAAYGLTAGAESPAAGVFRQGERFYLRALAALPGRSPHPVAGDPALDAGASAGDLPRLLHFEGNADAHFAWVRDSRLELIVDGATRIWTRDAHHQPPTT